MSIALSLGNNLTTGGIFKPTAVNNTSVNNVTDFAGITGGGTLVLLSTQTASASANISFTTGIDSTYDEYIFKFINIHPSATNSHLQFNGSTDGGSVVTMLLKLQLFLKHIIKKMILLLIYHIELTDLAQSTGLSKLTNWNIDNDNDSCTSGYLHII
jgi:hypothetical protein